MFFEWINGLPSYFGYFFYFAMTYFVIIMGYFIKCYIYDHEEFTYKDGPFANTRLNPKEEDVDTAARLTLFALFGTGFSIMGALILGFFWPISSFALIIFSISFLFLILKKKKYGRKRW